MLILQPTHYVTITTHSTDNTDSGDCEKIHLKKLVGQLKTNLCNVSILSEPDLELLSNMDPNSVADITGKEFVEQLKEASGRLDTWGNKKFTQNGFKMKMKSSGFMEN